MGLTLAQIAGFTIVHWIVVVIVIAAAVGILYVALQQFGVEVPPFAVKIFWIVVCAFVAILAIKILMGIA